MKDIIETDALLVTADGRRTETKVGFFPMKLTLDHLCIEYEVFQKENGLTLGPAHKHRDDETLTAAQRAWLVRFSQRWDNLAAEPA